MGTLSNLEKKQLERVLGMEGGYVLGFSNETFAAFFRDTVGIEIYDAVYCFGSGSKAKRMRAFWDLASDMEIAKVLEQLRIGLNDYSDRAIDPGAEEALLRVVRRLKNQFSTTEISAMFRRPIEEIEFAVALSFPGTHRNYVVQVANKLRNMLGPDQLFYDKDYQADLALPDLDTLLQNIYRVQSKLIVVFLGKGYAESDWCGLEWRVVRDVIKSRDKNRIMFVRLDGGYVEGTLSIDGFIDATEYDPSQVADFVIDRSRIRSTSPDKTLNLHEKQIDPVVTEQKPPPSAIAPWTAIRNSGREESLKPPAPPASDISAIPDTLGEVEISDMREFIIEVFSEEIDTWSLPDDTQIIAIYDRLMDGKELPGIDSSVLMLLQCMHSIIALKKLKFPDHGHADWCKSERLMAIATDVLSERGCPAGTAGEVAAMALELSRRAKVLRFDEQDDWRPGMASGSGYREYVTLSRAGKKLLGL